MLGGILGEYTKAAPDGSDGVKVVEGYGMTAYSPIAEGFGSAITTISGLRAPSATSARISATI